MASAFIFDRYHFEPETGALSLHYSFEQGVLFSETIMFPVTTRKMSGSDLAALDAMFRLVFLLSGVSYYKTSAPDTLICKAFALDQETATWVTKIYQKGLAEFAYRNKLGLEKLHFQSATGAPRTASPLNLSRRSLVPIGGGKDSIVTLECLKTGGETIALFALGSPAGIAAPIAATLAEADLPSLHVERHLAPQLAKLNSEGAFNGHVPITAILSAIALATALLHDFDTVILSNEHSASSPNLWLDEQEINHQYSKSLEFEVDMATYVSEHIASDLAYFSLLRPYSEAEIARRFSQHERYFPFFLSCNKAFKQKGHERALTWCGHCDKCRFVFLALAPFIEKDRLIKIFGKNLLADKAEQEGFAELCGLAKHKPFECVGEVGESALLMDYLARQENWKNEAVIKALAKDLHPPSEFDRLYQELFSPRPDHAVEETYLRMLNEGQ